MEILKSNLKLNQGNCWLEIKSRYIVQNEPYLNTKSINRLLENPLESDVEKYTLFRIIDSVLGVNLSVLVSLSDTLNALAMHCLVLKWFYETLLTSLFNHNASTLLEQCNINNLNETVTNSTTKPTSTNDVDVFMILVEILSSLVYFVAIKFAHGDYFASIRAFFDEISSRYDDTRLKSINKMVAYALFYILAAILLYLAVSNDSRLGGVRAECERFFKNLTTHSVNF